MNDITYAVTQRQREIGVRIALGAQRHDVLELVVGQGMRLVLAGVGIGLIGAFSLTRLLRDLLFGVGPIDPVTFATTPQRQETAGLLACWLPASRASRVDPMEALRYE